MDHGSVSRRSGTALALVIVASIAAMMVLAPPVWPLAQLGMLVPAALLVWRVPALRPLGASVAKGRTHPGLIALVGLSSGIALSAWAWLTKPDLSGAMAMVPEVPTVLLVAGAVGFAIVNATLEEIAFRGLLQSALASALRSMPAAIVLQAVAFGVAHLHGVPNGPLGAVMAGTWALVLGWVRERSDGLLTPILGHIAADLVIFGLLASGAAAS